MTHYNPRTVLRQISGPLLREFLEARGHTLPESGERQGRAQVQAVYDQYLKLPEAARRAIEQDLRDIHAVATEEGIPVLVETGRRSGRPIADELAQVESRCDMAVWVLLRRPDIWPEAVRFAHADSLPQRYWEKRNGLPKAAPDTSPEAVARLGAAISSYFVQAEGRGRLSLVEPFRRSEDMDYFFVYLSDHAGTEIVWNESAELVRERRNQAFEVVFAFDRSAGTLDLYARGGHKVIRPLQEIFADAVLGVTLPPEDPEACPYRVDGLKHRSFAFPTDGEDRIEEVAVRSLRLSVVGNRRKQFTVSLPDKAAADAMYDSLERELNQAQLPLSTLRVERATITMKLTGRGRVRRLSFEVGPTSCNLKGKREELRELGEKYLRRWGIEAS